MITQRTSMQHFVSLIGKMVNGYDLAKHLLIYFFFVCTDALYTYQDIYMIYYIYTLYFDHDTLSMNIDKEPNLNLSLSILYILLSLINSETLSYIHWFRICNLKAIILYIGNLYHHHLCFSWNVCYPLKSASYIHRHLHDIHHRESGYLHLI